jgi:hypothetical protein
LIRDQPGFGGDVAPGRSRRPLLVSSELLDCFSIRGILLADVLANLLQFESDR